jgi:hypothetical protein
MGCMGCMGRKGTVGGSRRAQQSVAAASGGGGGSSSPVVTRVVRGLWLQLLLALNVQLPTHRLALALRDVISTCPLLSETMCRRCAVATDRSC